MQNPLEIEPHPLRRARPPAAPGAGRAAALALAALAAVIVLAAASAWQGRLAARAAERDIARLRSEIATLRDSLQVVRERAGWSGAVQPLVLLEGDAVTPPRLQLHPDQPYLPIHAAHDLMGEQHDPGSRWMEIRILRAGGGEVWRHPERLSALWDPATRSVSLLVPCAPLREPGPYRLVIHEAGAPSPRFSAPFEIAPAGAPR
jgi:hypothetical protein